MKPMPNNSLDIVIRPRWSAVRAAMKRLTAVADARTTERAQGRFDRLVFRAQKSAAFTEAAYLATQVLRDMDVLSRGEATFVFRELFDLRSDEYSRNDPYPEARFHRARGELWLAELLLHDARTAMKLAAEGQCSLMVEKLDTDDAEVDTPDPAVVATICERIAAVATADTSRETIDRYHVLSVALGEAGVGSGMAAVGELREIGLVSFTESVGLISGILYPLVYHEVEADRECARLQARIDDSSRGHAEESGRPSTTGKAQWVEGTLDKRLDARKRVLIVMCLRRFGEHEAATLVIENPKEFDRLAGQIGVGVWGGPSVPDSSGGHGS
jgi:hypothetical protein